MTECTGYIWPGMRQITPADARMIFAAGETVFRLYPDNTECMVESESEILDNGDYGVEYAEFPNRDKEHGTKAVEAHLELPKKVIERYGRLMKLPAGHCDLADFPRYSTIESWTVKFDIPDYEMDIKVCSFGYADSLWAEAVLFYKGKELSFTEVADELAGPWCLSAQGTDFTVIVEAKEAISE